MNSRRTVAAAGALLVLASGCTQDRPQPAVTAEALTALRGDLAEAQAQGSIRSLMHSYGRLIDARDWVGFAKIWTDDAVYVGGPGSQTLVGGAAIAQFLQNIIAANPSGVGEPNFHVFFNEEIQVSGTQAKATSMSTFITPGQTGAPTMAILARYEDDFVFQDNAWKFKRRIVKGNLPAPQVRPK